MTDFYTQESDYVQQIKDYVKANGSYSNGKYILITDTSYSSGDTIQRAIVYSVSQDYIGLYVYMESSSGYYCGFMIQIESISTSYTWTMSDAYDYSMVGTIYSWFRSNTLLGYYSTSFPSSTVSSARELASNMANYILSYIDSDLSDLGITASDLGFVNY